MQWTQTHTLTHARARTHKKYIKKRARTRKHARMHARAHTQMCKYERQTHNPTDTQTHRHTDTQHTHTHTHTHVLPMEVRPRDGSTTVVRPVHQKNALSSIRVTPKGLWKGGGDTHIHVYINKGKKQMLMNKVVTKQIKGRKEEEKKRTPHQKKEKRARACRLKCTPRMYSLVIALLCNSFHLHCYFFQPWVLAKSVGSY